MILIMTLLMKGIKMSNKFTETLDKIGKFNEIKYLEEVIKDANRQEEIIKFINENNIDCNHLWEDSEEGDKSTEDWHKLAKFVFNL